VWGSGYTAAAVIGLGIVMLTALRREQTAGRLDPALTPGAVASHSVAEVCEPGYARSHRVWGQREKYAITLPRYRIPAAAGHLYEDDDLIPICAGGDNADPRNHWPQRCDAWRGPVCIAGPAHQKDWQEARTCRAVCDGTMPLDAAQDYFRHWGR
jgi:hypothetical protein